MSPEEQNQAAPAERSEGEHTAAEEEGRERNLVSRMAQSMRLPQLVQSVQQMMQRPRVRRMGVSALAGMVGAVLSENILGGLAVGGFTYVALGYLDEQLEQQGQSVAERQNDRARARRAARRAERRQEAATEAA